MKLPFIIGMMGVLAFAGCNKCGDGKLKERKGEQCDDANNADGDGCSAVCEFETGGVSFSYVLLFNDAGQVAAAQTCADVGVSSVRFAIGDDLDASGTLDNTEEVVSLEADCNQADANGDGIIAEEDFGAVSINGIIPPDVYGAISFSFLDAAGNFVPWQTFDVATDADIFSFLGNTNITAGDITDIALPGDAQQVNGELQVFFGF